MNSEDREWIEAQERLNARRSREEAAGGISGPSRAPRLAGDPTTEQDGGVEDVVEGVIEAFRPMVERRKRVETAVDAELARVASSGIECPRHPGVRMIPDRDRMIRETSLGWRDTGAFPRPAIRFGMCPECRTEVEQAPAMAASLALGIPENLALVSLDGFRVEDPGDESALSAARTFAQRRAGFLFLLSPGYGCGKSHLAAAILREVGRGIFITHYDLLAGLRETYGAGNSARYLGRFKTTRLLVLDDLGTSVGGADDMACIHEIFDARYRSMMPTVVTANCARPEDLVAKIGERAYDRMREAVAACVVLTSRSRRKEGKSDYLQRAVDKSKAKG